MNEKKSSEKLFEHARKVTPGGVNSPVRSCKHVGVSPVFFERAKGAFLYDVSGKEYIDFCLSFGPHILGHTHPALVSALVEQAERATSFGACHPKEVELADWLLKAYPFLDQVRLVNSGTEAVMTAIRLARGYTKRPKILKFEGCYHGHSDAMLVSAGSGVAELAEASSLGVPKATIEDTLVARFDRTDSVREAFKKYPDQIAAIIFEPIPANHGLYVSEQGRIEEICSIANQYGALTIADEVISGFRVGWGGACARYNIHPDIVTLGKIIGGGLPLAAIVGRKAVMETLAPLGGVYQAGTLSGNPLATAAGCAVLKEIYSEKPYSALEKETQWFANELKSILQSLAPVEIRTLGSIFWIQLGDFDSAFPPAVTPRSHELYTQLFKGALSEGIYLAPSPYEVGFLSTAHTKAVLEKALNGFRNAVKAK